jgi:hypothetical protein
MIYSLTRLYQLALLPIDVSGQFVILPLAAIEAAAEVQIRPGEQN